MFLYTVSFLPDAVGDCEMLFVTAFGLVAVGGVKFEFILT